MSAVWRCFRCCVEKMKCQPASEFCIIPLAYKTIVTTKGRLLLLILALTTVANASALVRGPPQVSSSYSKRHLVRSGDSLRLTCPVEADSQSLIEWQKDGESIHLGWSRFRLTESALRIKDLEVSDTGIYVCKATNGFGSVDAIFQIYVYSQVNNSGTPVIDFDDYFKDFLGPGEKPSFLRPEQMKDNHIIQSVGTTAWLRCRATGKPMPDIVWYKDGMILPEEMSSSGPSEGSSSHWKLKLSDLKMSDSGKYTCKAFNKLGTINFTYTVQIVDRLSKPVIQDIHNSTVVAGDTLVLQCHVYSEDQPKVEWLKRLDRPTHRGQEKNLTITIENERYILIQPGGETMSLKQNTYLNKLMVHDVTEEDDGLYMCSCASSMGLAFRSTFVTVLPGPPTKDLSEEVDGEQGGYAFLPIIIALTTVFGLVFLLVIIVVIHCRHVDNRRNPKVPELPRASTMTSSLTSRSAEKQHGHHYAVLQPQQALAPSQKHLMENIFQPTNNHVVDARSDHSSVLKTAPMLHPTSHTGVVHAHHQHLHNHHNGHQVQHLRYPLL